VVEHWHVQGFGIDSSTEKTKTKKEESETMNKKP
jgi:hypothetical protein